MLIFFDCLKRFHSYIERTKNRKVLLILEMVLGNGSQQCIPSFSAVEIMFFHSNTT